MMMINMICMKRISFILLFSSIICCCFAQSAKDFESRLEVGADYKPFKRTEIGFGYRATYFDNSTRFKHSMFSFGAAYDIRKWWTVGGEYRFYTSRQQDQHRFIAFTKFGYRINKKLALSYKLQYQQTQDYFEKEYLQFFEPNKVFRNRFQVKYDYTKKIQLSAFIEPFHKLKHAELNLYRFRYGIGADYLHKKRHSLGVQLFVTDEFNVKSPEDRLTLKLGYQYHLVSGRAKAKKSKSAEKTNKKP
jgi:hypothetical protein